jgi:hypothetical protein
MADEGTDAMTGEIPGGGEAPETLWVGAAPPRIGPYRIRRLLGAPARRPGDQPLTREDRDMRNHRFRVGAIVLAAAALVVAGMATTVRSPLAGPSQGVVDNHATDAREGLPPLAPTAAELQKLAAAREACAAAEAAGTRWLEPAEHAVTTSEAAERLKLQRLHELTPRPLTQRPGVPEGERGGAR